MSAKSRLLEDARDAGYDIEWHGVHVNIVKRTPKTRKITYGIKLCEDGTAFRIDVDLGVTTTIRTFKQMRDVLGIKR